MYTMLLVRWNVTLICLDFELGDFRAGQAIEDWPGFQLWVKFPLSPPQRQSLLGLLWVVCLAG